MSTQSWDPQRYAQNARFVSDLGMPMVDGYELIRQVRQIEKSLGTASPVPAIALTAYVRERHRAQALAAGFQEYIPKPIDPEVLIAASLRLLKREGGISVEKKQ